MAWRMHLDVIDDGNKPERSSKWRRRATFGSVLALASLWLVAVAVLAVWLAARIA